MTTPRDSKFRLPEQPILMAISPEMAQDWLDHRNNGLRNSRALSPLSARKIADAMLAGDYDIPTHQGLAFDTEGWLLDGRHRLTAIANTGLTIWFWVFPDLPRETFNKMDVGLRRTPQQFIHAPNATILAATVRYLAVTDGIALPVKPREAVASLTLSSTMDLVRHYGVDLERAAKDTAMARKMVRMPPSPLAATAYQAINSPHADLLTGWLDGLTTGVNLGSGDARLRLRSLFLSAPASVQAGARRSQAYTYAIVMKAWNAHVLDKSVQILGWRNDEPLPTAVGYIPKPYDGRVETRRDR